MLRVQIVNKSTKQRGGVEREREREGGRTHTGNGRRLGDLQVHPQWHTPSSKADPSRPPQTAVKSSNTQPRGRHSHLNHNTIYCHLLNRRLKAGYLISGKPLHSRWEPGGWQWRTNQQVMAEAFIHALNTPGWKEGYFEWSLERDRVRRIYLGGGGHDGLQTFSELVLLRGELPCACRERESGNLWSGGEDKSQGSVFRSNFVFNELGVLDCVYF